MAFFSVKHLISPLCCIALFVTAVPAKTKWVTPSNEAMIISPNTQNLQQFENRLTPFLHHRINRHNRRGTVRTPRYTDNGSTVSPFTEADLRYLPKIWNQLSAEFQNLYLAAVALPDSMLSYHSPGGHFEIFYAITGIDSVATTDFYGFSSTNWRIRNNKPNGIPDYIDEVAWAADSSWSMEIDKFGFIAPYPYKDATHQSNLYKVVVEDQTINEGNEGALYGVTFLQGRMGGTRGFTSSISLRNSWSPALWHSEGYDTLPQNGARVTMAHEFFHAIQYAMTWNIMDNIYLDDFPYSWIEGTAASMEELAFDSINDYIQYSATFFANPSFSFVSSRFSREIYTNSLIVLYLYRNAAAAQGIGLVKSIFFENYKRKISFYPTLHQTVASNGKLWVDLLNDFHTASYFTGYRADTTRFLADAAIFSTWNAPTATAINKISLTAPSYGMTSFKILPQSSHEDSLQLLFSGSTEQSAGFSGKSWALSAILHRSNLDSVVSVAIDSAAHGRYIIGNWKSFDWMTVIVSNGDPYLAREATCFAESCPIAYHAKTVATFTAQTQKYSSNASAALFAHSNLRCPLTITATSDPVTLDALGNLLPVSSAFSVEYPQSWQESATVSLTIATTYDADSTDSILLCRFDEFKNVWTLYVDKPGEKHAHTLSISMELAEPGIYGLFLRQKELLAFAPITIYPNPCKLHKNSVLNFIGPNLDEIALFTITGNRIATQSLINRSGLRYQWDLSTIFASHRCVPGVYSVVMVQRDPETNTIHRTHQKIMITP